MTLADVAACITAALFVGFLVGLIIGEHAESKFTHIERKAHYHWFDCYHALLMQSGRKESVIPGKGPRLRATASAKLKRGKK